MRQANKRKETVD